MLKIRDRQTNTMTIKILTKRSHACSKLVREKCQKLDQKVQTGQSSEKKSYYTKYHLQTLMDTGITPNLQKIRLYRI